MPWLPSNSRAISKPPEIPWTPENGILLPRNVSAAPIGKQKLRKALRGLAPPSLPKFRRCPNANPPHKQRKVPLNRKSLPSKLANRPRKLLQWSMRRPAPLVELQGRVADVVAAAARVQQHGGPKVPCLAGNPRLLHPSPQLPHQKSKRQAALLIPALKSRSPKLRRLRFVAARAIPACRHASRSWK